MLRQNKTETTEHKTPTPRTDDSLEGLLDAFQNLDLNTKNPFIDFYRTEDMAETTPIAKKTELNLPKIFTGKRTDLQRFLQDTFVFLTINKDVRVSPVTLRFGSEMDPYRRDLTNILHSYLVSDSLGPVLGARAWSCKTANDYLGLSQLWNTSKIFGERGLRLPPGLSMFYIAFLLYGLMGLTILDHIYSSFL